MPDSETISFFSKDLSYAQSIGEVELRAPINHDGVIQVGLPIEDAKAAPKTELKIVGATDAVRVSRVDGEPIQAELIWTDDITQQTTAHDILKDGVEEIVFERGNMKKIPGKGFMREWITSAALNDLSITSLAQVIGTSCLRRLKDQHL